MSVAVTWGTWDMLRFWRDQLRVWPCLCAVVEVAAFAWKNPILLILVMWFVFWCLAFVNPIHQTINKLWFLYRKTQFETTWKQYKQNHIGMQCRNAAPFLKTELQTVRAPRHPEMSAMSIFKNFRFKLVRQTAANTFWTNGKSWQTPNSIGLLLISGENVLPMFVLKSSSSQSRRNQRCHPSWNQRRSKNKIG